MADVLVAVSTRFVGRLGLALLWTAAGLAALAPPETVREAAPPALRRVMEPVAEGAAVAVAAAPDGAIWWVTRDRAVRFPGGAASRPLPNLDFGAGPPGLRGVITAAHVDRRGALWLGTRHGAVWSYRDGAWRELFGGFRARGAPITALATHAGRVYVGSTGLWRGTPDAPLAALPAFDGVPIRSAAAHPRHGVVVAGSDRVWRGDAAGWREVWRARRAREAATAVVLSPEGALWIGTGRGLLRLDAAGRMRRHLVGAPIASLAAREDGAVFAGTRGAGLFLHHARGWRRLGDAAGHDIAHVTALAPGAGGALWLALRDGALLRAGPASEPLPSVGSGGR